MLWDIVCVLTCTDNFEALVSLQPFMGMSRNVEECCVTSHPTLKETTLSHRMATENSHAVHTLKPYPYQVAGHAAQGEPYE